MQNLNVIKLIKVSIFGLCLCVGLINTYSIMQK